MDDQSTVDKESRSILDLIDSAATAESRRRHAELDSLIDHGDRLIAQQIVARSARDPGAKRVAEVVAANPTPKKRWWQR